MKKLIIVMFFALVSNSVVFAQAKRKLIRNVTVTFNTTTNDKDHDTYLSVYFNTHDYADNVDYFLAKKEGIGGHWNNNSVNTVTLDLAGEYDLENYKNAFFRLTISPNGNDKWEFNYTVNVTYVDENNQSHTITKEFAGKILTQDNTTLSDPLF